MKNQAYSRKKRQLKALSQKVQVMMKEPARNERLLEKMLLKLKHLLAELRLVVSRTELQKALGGLAVFFGIAAGNQVQAQSFDPPVTNPFGLVPTTYFAAPTFVDIDNDGDLDLMVGEYGDTTQQYGEPANIKFFENTGDANNPQFAAPVGAPFGIDTAGLVYLASLSFADLDNDGDQDMLVGTASYYGYTPTLVYYENTGTANAPQFAKAPSLPGGLTSGNYFSMPDFVDLDNDGDFDLLIGEYVDTSAYYGYVSLTYFENTGTNSSPQFAAPVRNAFGLASTLYFADPTFADMDMDGDQDLLVGEYYGNLIYFENTGTASSPQFAAPVTNPFGLSQAYQVAFPDFADIDGDSDIDLLVGEYDGNMLLFENNTTGVGLNELPEAFEFEIFPNPATNELNMDTREPIAKLEILEITGKLLIKTAHPQERINIESLKPGEYILRVTNRDAQVVNRKFQKK